MDLFTPYAIDDLMHFTRMGSPANIVLPLLMLASFAGQIFFMLRGGKSSRIVLIKFAFLVLILSELDPKRQEFVLNRIAGGQVFITCCEDDRLERMLRGKVLRIRDGRLI